MRQTKLLQGITEFLQLQYWKLKCLIFLVYLRVKCFPMQYIFVTLFRRYHEILMNEISQCFHIVLSKMAVSENSGVGVIVCSCVNFFSQFAPPPLSSFFFGNFRIDAVLFCSTLISVAFAICSDILNKIIQGMWRAF